MKNLFTINEEEKNRILNLHETATKRHYLSEQGNSDFKPSIFAQGLIISLVMVLEELVSDCLKNVNKDKTGLYTINQLILSNLLNTSDKYDFVSKYMKKYSSMLKYHDSVFFNINKVITNLEDKHGSKLMIESDKRPKLQLRKRK